MERSLSLWACDRTNFLIELAFIKCSFTLSDTSESEGRGRVRARGKEGHAAMCAHPAASLHGNGPLARNIRLRVYMWPKCGVCTAAHVYDVCEDLCGVICAFSRRGHTSQALSASAQPTLLRSRRAAEESVSVPMCIDLQMHVPLFIYCVCRPCSFAFTRVKHVFKIWIRVCICFARGIPEVCRSRERWVSPHPSMRCSCVSSIGVCLNSERGDRKASSDRRQKKNQIKGRNKLAGGPLRKRRKLRPEET